jgi:hypothetical protein
MRTSDAGQFDDGSMMRYYLSVVYFLSSLYLAASANGAEVSRSDLFVPPSDHIQIIATADGSTSMGRISDISDTTVTFATELGVIIIPIDRITSIRTVPVSDVREGSYWFPDPNTTRLYFAPTGRMLPKGGGYIADYYLFFPSFNYGVSSKVSLGGGFSIFPTGSMSDQVYFFTPKISIKRSKYTNIAAGALLLKIPDSDNENTPLVSVLYGVSTWGTPGRSITVGFGYGMVDDDFADRPMIVLGGEKRMTRRTAFVTENWVIPGLDDALASYGIRFIANNFTTDFALINTIGSHTIFPGIPYIDFVFNF